MDVHRSPAGHPLDRGAAVADDYVDVGHRLGDIERGAAAPSELTPLQSRVRPRLPDRRRPTDRGRVVVPEEERPRRPLGESRPWRKGPQVDRLAQPDDLAGSDAAAMRRAWRSDRATVAATTPGTGGGR